jgi:hypothetical protein
LSERLCTSRSGLQQSAFVDTHKLSSMEASTDLEIASQSVWHQICLIDGDAEVDVWSASRNWNVRNRVVYAFLASFTLLSSILRAFSDSCIRLRMSISRAIISES